jgi:hypothetical protein
MGKTSFNQLSKDEKLEIYLDFILDNKSVTEDIYEHLDVQSIFLNYIKRYEYSMDDVIEDFNELMKKEVNKAIISMVDGILEDRWDMMWGETSQNVAESYISGIKEWSDCINERGY